MPKLPIPSFDQLKPRERLLAVGGGLVLVLVVLDRLVLSPWLRHGQAVRREIKQMEASLQRSSQLLARKDQVFAKLNAYQSYLKSAEADDLHMATLLKEIEGIAAESHILLGEVKPIAPEVVNGAKQYALDVRFECTMEAWLDFIYHLEASASFFQIARAGLSVQEETPDRLEGLLRVVSTAMAEDKAGATPATEEGHEPPPAG